jgi:hypothetical protein
MFGFRVKNWEQGGAEIVNYTEVDGGGAFLFAYFLRFFSRRRLLARSSRPAVTFIDSIHRSFIGPIDLRGPKRDHARRFVVQRDLLALA